MNANTIYEAHRRRMIAYGRWHPYVAPDRARDHVQALRDAGMGLPTIARRARLSIGVLQHLVYGDPAEGIPPARQIRPENEAKILAVRATLDMLAGGAFIDATGTRRRLQALVAVGWSRVAIGERIGADVNRLTTGRYTRVTAAKARAVCRLYDELWDQRPAETTKGERISASKARHHAQARGWAPPAAWDDATIDDPAARPHAWQATRTTWPHEELAAEGQWLMDQGYNREQAAGRLGVSPDALARAIQRTAAAQEAEPAA